MTEACPCGSGRTLDRCCSEPLTDPELQYTSEDREHALRKMETLRARPTLRRFENTAVEIFWETALPDDEKAARAFLADPTLQSAFIAFLCWDIGEFEEQPLGELLMEELGKRLSRGERAFLRAGLESHWGIYEVLETRPGVGLLVQDLWRPKRVWIQERSASQQLVRFDLLGGRVIKRPQGQHEFEGDLLDFTFPRKSQLLACVHDLYDFELEGRPNLTDREFFKGILPTLVSWWVQVVATPGPMPELRTPEGDPWHLCRARFTVRDREELIRALEFATDLSRTAPDELEWTWIEPSGTADRILARIELGEQELLVETSSTERMARARTYLAKITEGHLAHIETTEESFAELMKKHAGSTLPEDELPQQAQREAVLKVTDAHFRDWLDEKTPALDNWTPRRAAREQRMRARVVELLKGIENMEGGKRRAGRIAYDAAWMWKELGLERPGC